MATTTSSPRQGTSPVRRRDVPWLRAGTAVVAVAVAYHYSLGSLTGTLTLDTPLAYLGLVPFLGLAVGAVKMASQDRQPDIHDRQLDYIVGLTLLSLALAVVVLAPARMSTLFWVWRIDLLTLPAFAAGAFAIAVGLRAMWRIRAAIVFLLVAWPLPYTRTLDALLQWSTRTTAAGVRAAVKLVPLAEPVRDSDGSLFRVSHAGRAFELAISSVCAGVNSTLGFVLVGAALLLVIRGTRVHKLAWLATGAALVWAVNVVRILGIFLAGRLWGQDVALDVVHPIIGLVVFCVAIVAMILLLPVFGLQLGRARNGPKASTDVESDRADGGEESDAAGEPVLEEGAPAAKPTMKPTGAAGPGRRSILAVLVLVVASAAAAVGNAGFREYALVADSLGVPRLIGFSEHPAEVPGWSLGYYAQYDYVKQYFGDKASWLRFLYSGDGMVGSELSPQAPAPVILDVISTTSRQALKTHGLEACYRFHGFKVIDSSRVDLGSGIVANAISYYNPKDRRDWSALYWESPVHTGQGLRYERVAFMLIDAARLDLGAVGTTPASPAPHDRSLEAAGGADQVPRLRNFLVSFAQTAVRIHGSQSRARP